MAKKKKLEAAAEVGGGKRSFSARRRRSGRRGATGAKTGVKVKAAEVDDGSTKTGLGVSAPARPSRDTQPIKHGLGGRAPARKK